MTRIQELIFKTVTGLCEDFESIESPQELPPIRRAAVERLAQWMPEDRAVTIVSEAEKTYKKEEKRGKNR